MAGEEEIIYINGHEWKDVTNETTPAPTYSYEEAESISYWPYKTIATSNERKGRERW